MLRLNFWWANNGYCYCGTCVKEDRQRDQVATWQAAARDRHMALVVDEK